VNPADATFLRWWRRLALAGGVVSVLLGLVLLVWPKETLVVVAVLLGLWLVISGVVQIVQAALLSDRSGGTRVLEALTGLLLVVVGVLCLRHLANTLELLAALVGIAWLLLGFVQLWSALFGPARGWSRAAGAILGGTAVLGGLLVLIWPGITLLVLVWLAGAWLVVLGAVQLVLAWRARNTIADRPVPQ